MPTTIDYKKEDQGVFALFKGDSGSGKSVAALSFPQPYVFDHDFKMPNMALKHFPGKEIAWDTFNDIFLLQDKINELKRNCPYETLIADSMTNLIVTVLNTISDVKGEPTMDLLRKFKTTRSGGKQLELMGYDYYNGETRFIEQYWIDEMKKLWARPGNPKNVIIIAHVMTKESAPDIETKVVTKTRSLVTAGRSVAAYIPTVFDDAWHFGYERDMATSALSRVCFTSAQGEDFAKTSFKIPDKIYFTNKNFYDELQKRIKGDMSI